MTLAMILTALPLAGVTAFAEAYVGEPNEHTSGDFRYIICANNTVGISGYTGSAEKLNIPSKLDTYTVTSIEYGAFEGCDNLISVSIPNSITSIGNSTFRDCESLTNITIPESVISIGDEAFLNTGYYNNPANWQNGVLYIDNCLIEAKSNEIPQNYKINEGTRVIADSAFEDCDSLTSVTIPEGVTSIGRLAFSYCDNLTSVAIGNGVTSIGDDAFSCCYSLTSVTIPNSVTSIGESVFYECYSLTSVTIPESVTSIGEGTFAYCRSLTNAAIPDSVTSIGGMAFAYCESLTSVTIPESVTSIGEGAFEGCENLTEIKVDTNNKNYTSQDGVLFNKNKTELIQYPIGNERKTYDIPKGVTSIGDLAFVLCDSLPSITIPDSVTNIGDYAFGWCSLISVTIPDSVTKIGNYAFAFCYSLTDIYILNKECNIEEDNEDPDALTIPTETTIHGYAGSTAESYAKENGNKFVAIDGEPVTPDPDKQNAIGDVDGNANITITDAKWILQNTVKSRNLTEAQAKAADLNKDGKITIVDAKWVLQIVVGLRDAQTLKPIKK